MKIKLISKTGRIAIYSDVTSMIERVNNLEFSTQKYRSNREDHELLIEVVESYTDNEKEFKQYRQNNIPNEVAVERTEDERTSGASEESEGSVRTQP